MSRYTVCACIHLFVFCAFRNKGGRSFLHQLNKQLLNVILTCAAPVQRTEIFA